MCKPEESFGGSGGGIGFVLCFLGEGGRVLGCNVGVLGLAGFRALGLGWCSSLGFLGFSVLQAVSIGFEGR